jgi:hypothetical protein
MPITAFLYAVYEHVFLNYNIFTNINKGIKNIINF